VISIALPPFDNYPERTLKIQRRVLYIRGETTG
jgi:hypothetical protein